MKSRITIVVVICLLSIGAIIGYQVVKASKDKVKPEPVITLHGPNSTSTPLPIASLPNKEQVNTNGTRRPIQYIHICDSVSNPGNLEYVTQGTPDCLGNDKFESNYSTSVDGIVYSSPCKTNSTPVRYVYIDNEENCPSGTTLVFYNSLGASSGSSSPVEPTVDPSSGPSITN
jgi:hypothetical protein